MKDQPTAFTAALVVFSVITGVYLNSGKNESESRHSVKLDSRTYSASLKTSLLPLETGTSGPASDVNNSFIGFMVLDNATAFDHSKPRK